MKKSVRKSSTRSRSRKSSTRTRKSTTRTRSRKSSTRNRTRSRSNENFEHNYDEPININKNMPRKSSISYRMMAEEKEDISPLQEDVSYDILNSDSLVNVSIDSDRTYYYSNQDYKGISKAIDKNVPIDYDVNNIALFVGEGHIFNLLPTLSKYVSQVIVIDRDDKLINYKRNELKAFIESDSVDEYYSSLFRYMGSFYPIYITASKDFALMGLELAIGFKQLTEDCF